MTLGCMVFAILTLVESDTKHGKFLSSQPRDDILRFQTWPNTTFNHTARPTIVLQMKITEAKREEGTYPQLLSIKHSTGKEGTTSMGSDVSIDSNKEPENILFEDVESSKFLQYDENEYEETVRNIRDISGSLRHFSIATHGVTSAVNHSFPVYTIQLHLGTPAQNMDLVVDTVNDVVSIKCGGPNTCLTRSSRYCSYNSHISTTFERMSCASATCQQIRKSKRKEYYCKSSKTPCSFNRLGFENGQWVVDNVRLHYGGSGNTSMISRTIFGCTPTKSTPSTISGYLGLSRGPFSFISQLSAKKFSYCLVPIAQGRMGSTSPIMIGSEANLNNSLYGELARPGISRAQTTPLFLSDDPTLQNYHLLSLQGIEVNGVLITVPRDMFDGEPRGNTIIDTVIPFTLLHHDAYEPLAAAIKSMVNYPLVDLRGSWARSDVCFNVTGVPRLSLPIITFKFAGGADWRAPITSSYILGAENMACLAILPASKRIPVTVLGNYFQQNFQLAFDLEQSLLHFEYQYCSMWSSSSA